MSCPSQSTQLAEFHNVILTTQLLECHSVVSIRINFESALTNQMQVKLNAYFMKCTETVLATSEKINVLINAMAHE